MEKSPTLARKGKSESNDVKKKKSAPCFRQNGFLGEKGESKPSHLLHSVRNMEGNSRGFFTCLRGYATIQSQPQPNEYLSRGKQSTFSSLTNALFAP